MKKIDHLELDLNEELNEKLAYLYPDNNGYRILKKSIDARKGKTIKEIFSLEVYDKGEIPTDFNYPIESFSNHTTKPIIVGTGPCGLFAALRLAERGIPSLILERGSPAEKRVMKINRFWRYGELDPNDNVCFGEGGAGLYSDGKLITRIRSQHIAYILQRLVSFGAPAEIQYLANPHVGSDRLRRLIPKIRERLQQLGCEFRFNTQVKELIAESGKITGVQLADNRVLNSDHIVLATGHSATDLYLHLKELGVQMEGKSYAIGVRIEHPQELINKIQFRSEYANPKLGAANYRLADHDHDSGIGVYSFCMCPGGYILSSGTEQNGIVCNGMSNYHRGSPFANSGIVVSIDHQKQFGDDTFAGLNLRAKIESEFYNSVIKAGGNKHLPAQLTHDFIEERSGSTVKSSTPSGVVPSRLDQILPPNIKDRIIKSLLAFDKLMPGFIGKESQLHAVESRTSSPLRILRDKETLESLSHKGLYPGGEGAGYAGGITSAAVDGVRIAEKIAEKVLERQFTETW